MKIKKYDEMGLSVVARAARIAFAFSTLALLAWSIYSFASTGKLNNWAWIILLMQVLVFWVSYLLYNRKLVGNTNDEK